MRDLLALKRVSITAGRAFLECVKKLIILFAGVYERLTVSKGTEKEMEIVRDLSRTYPSHIFYQQRQGVGQRALYNVLKAYSIYDRQASRALP